MAAATATGTGFAITREGSQLYVTGSFHDTAEVGDKITPLLTEEEKDVEGQTSETFDLHRSLARVHTKEWRWYHVLLTVAGLALVVIPVFYIFKLDPTEHHDRIKYCIALGVGALAAATCTGSVAKRLRFRCQTGPKRKLTSHIERVRAMSLPKAPKRAVTTTEFKEALDAYLRLTKADETGDILREALGNPDNAMVIFEVSAEHHIPLFGKLLKGLDPTSESVWSRALILKNLTLQYKNALPENKPKDCQFLFDLYLHHGIDSDAVSLGQVFETPEELVAMCRAADGALLCERTKTLSSSPYRIPEHWGKKTAAIMKLSLAFDKNTEHFGYQRSETSVYCMFDHLNGSQATE